MLSITVKSKQRNAVECVEKRNHAEIWRFEAFFTELCWFPAAVRDLRHSASEAAAKLVCKSVYSGAPCEVISHKEAKLKICREAGVSRPKPFILPPLTLLLSQLHFLPLHQLLFELFQFWLFVPHPHTSSCASLMGFVSSFNSHPCPAAEGNKNATWHVANIKLCLESCLLGCGISIGFSSFFINTTKQFCWFTSSWLSIS